MDISIIGLGTVGFEIFKKISKTYKSCIGVDIDERLINKLKSKYNVSKNLSISDVYMIEVYTSKQILSVIKKIKKINHSKRPLIIIESTINPIYIKKIITISEPNSFCNLVICPHRLNLNDKDHHVFNLNRVISGATKECLKKGISFYSTFMSTDLLTKTDINHAVMSKITENAYRFLEISIAEELNMIFKSNKSLNINFNELRRCTNSKWNIDIKEARDGIHGKCLSKDINIVNKFIKNNKIFNLAVKIDNKYKSIKK